MSGTNTRKYITVHETGNTGSGANAQAHANLQSRGNSRNASWHWQVDDKQAVQSYEHTARCKHAGDNTGSGNYASIAVEICVNKDGDYVQALKNAVELVRQIMAQEGIPASHVVQHNHWSGKDCPTQLRAGRAMTWATFKTLLLTTTSSKDWFAMATEAELRKIVREELNNLLNTVINSNPSSGKPSTLRESIAIACNYAYRGYLEGRTTNINKTWGYVGVDDNIDIRQRIVDIHEGLGLPNVHPSKRTEPVKADVGTLGEVRVELEAGTIKQAVQEAVRDTKVKVELQ